MNARENLIVSRCIFYSEDFSKRKAESDTFPFSPGSEYSWHSRQEIPPSAENGVLQQFAPPLEMYGNPANLFVADFMGNPTMNFMNGTAECSGNTAKARAGGLDLTFTAPGPIDLSGDEIVLGVRPEHIRITDEGSEATVYSTLPSGMETTVKLDPGTGEILTAVVFGNVDYPADSKIHFAFTGDAVLFDKATGKNIGKGTLTLA